MRLYARAKLAVRPVTLASVAISELPVLGIELTGDRGLLGGVIGPVVVGSPGFAKQTFSPPYAASMSRSVLSFGSPI